MARPRSDIEPRILHAARSRFLAEGVDGASLRAIAKDAGTSIGMVYYYFPTKDDLFLAIVEEVYERVLSDLETALAPDVPVEERLRRVYERMGRLDDEELTVIRLVVREALVSSARLDRVIERFRRGHIPLVLRMLADGLADGTFNARRHPLVLLGSIAGVGFIPQVMRRVMAGRLPFPMPPGGAELAAELVSALLGGVGARATVDPPQRPPGEKAKPRG